MKKITLSLLFGLFTFFGFSQIGLVENFDAGLTLPPGWTGAGYSGSVFQTCSVVSLRANLSASNLSDDLISPNIVGQSNGTDLTVAFDYKIVDWSAAVDPTPPGWGEFLVQYSTNNGTAWTTMGTINDVNHVTSNTCANMSFVLPAASIPVGSSFKLRFLNNYFSGDYYFYIDNVTASQVVVDPPSCVNLISPTNGQTGVAITANLSWTAATGIPTGYTLSVGTSPGGTDIVDNLDVGLSTTYDLPDLDYSTIYYVTIIPYNGNGPAVGCSEYSFTTGADPNAPVDCGSGIPINTVFCYTNNDNTTFSFISSDGSPLVVVFNSGSTENNWDELIVLDSDGVTNLNAATPYGNAGNLAGLQFISTGDTITVGVTSDGSGISCTTNPWNFDVSCVDETALPNCNANLTNPLNGAIDVDVASQITWTSASVLVTGYVISIGTTPGGTDIADNIDVGNVLTYTPTNILPYESTIYVTIIPYNDNGSAINCNENSFVTEVNPYQCDAADQCVFTFTLEDDFGDGWNGNTMTVSQDGLEIEIITLPSGTGPLEIQIPLCDGIPFELFWNAGGSFANEVMISVSDPFGDVIYTMPAGSGGLRNTLLFSDMVNCTPPTCPRPTDVTVGIINMTDVEISWTETGTATTWEVIVQPLGTGYPDGTEPEIIQTTDNPYLYENLDAGTQYEIYVRAVCAADDLSDWEGPVAFDTTICDAADQCVFTFILEDDWGDGWNGNTMTVSQNGVPIQTITLATGAGPLEIQIPLCDGVPFELFWNAGGSFAGEVMISVNDAFDEEIFTMLNGNANLQGTLIFTSIVNCTPPTCPRPDDVTIVDVNPTSVEVSWTPGGAETTWEVIVQPLGTGYPDGTEPEIIQTTDNPYLYEGLTPGIEYEIYVRGICAANDLSDWEGPEDFKTPFLVDCAAAEVINTTYCYGNGDNTFVELFSFQSSGGFPLNILFNAGEIEDPWDNIRITDADGNILYEGNNGGNLAGLQLTSPGDSLILLLESDGSGSCSTSGYTPWDFDVWCQTCIPQTVSFDIVNGDCITDPNNPVFEVQVDITDMGDAASLMVTDNQGSTPQTATGAGILIFGPYAEGTNIVITVENEDDANCIVVSNPLAFICPPPPNPCSIVFAGDDTSVDCNNPSVDLTANFHLYGQDTTNYEINSIDTCPSPPVDGATPTSINTDDVWSDVIDLGFEFCFYGGVYNKIIVGSNGVLSFEIENANTYNEWDLAPFGEGPSTLPNTTNTTITEANIFGVGHDIDPSVCGSIDYVVLGSAPYRQFVVNYNAVCQFGTACNALQSTSQIILHESSNNIDIHVLNKPTCTSWNDGLAVIGLQNIDNTAATSPTGRNTGVWTVTTEESWRFSPSGTPNYTLEWLDEYGNVIGTNDTVTVSPTQTSTYTFAVTYDLCTGGTATVTDNVEVEYINLSTYDASFEMAATCNGATATILGDTGGEFTFNPIPTDGATIDATTGEITNGVPGTTYTVQYTVGEVSCPAINTIDIMIFPIEIATFTMTASCNGATATIIGDTGGTFTFNPVPTDGATIDPVTGEITNGLSGTTYTVEYATSGPCPETTNQMVTILLADDASFTLTANCSGAIAAITGNTGGTFAFNPVPTDGAVIDPVTGEITNGVTGATYTVVYTTVGNCPNTSSQSVTIPSLEDASFTLTATCNGATANITGDTGGVFTFNPIPSDGATINASTGEITNGVSGTTYTVVYTTSGACFATSTQTVTVLTAEDASFTMMPSCSGAIATVTGNTGGTFVFNPDPGDGATIDPVTGEITNGVPEETYTVEYITSGVCSEMSTEIVTLLASPEDASFSINTTTCDGGTVQIDGDTGGIFSFNPVPSDGATINVSTGEVTGGESDTTYTIEYTTAGNCPVTYSESFTTEECELPVIPQVITPNGDGKNDSFDLTGYDVSSLEVFNRNGIKVYSRSNYTNEFTGTSDKGDKLPTGTYFYVMRYQGSEVKSAWLYINREQ